MWVEFSGRVGGVSVNGLLGKVLLVGKLGEKERKPCPNALAPEAAYYEIDCMGKLFSGQEKKKKMVERQQRKEENQKKAEIVQKVRHLIMSHVLHV